MIPMFATPSISSRTSWSEINHLWWSKCPAFWFSEHYDELERSRKLPRAQSIAIGDVGVIRFVDDQMWYRARVVKSEEEGRIRVLLIDSGHLDIKFLDEFFSLDPQFATLPAQAIGCTLSQACAEFWLSMLCFYCVCYFVQAFPPSSTDDNNLWPSETIEMFRHEVQNKTVEVRFVETDEITATWCVYPSFFSLTINSLVYLLGHCTLSLSWWIIRWAVNSETDRNPSPFDLVDYEFLGLETIDRSKSESVHCWTIVGNIARSWLYSLQCWHR